LAFIEDQTLTRKLRENSRGCLGSIGDGRIDPPNGIGSSPRQTPCRLPAGLCLPAEPFSVASNAATCRVKRTIMELGDSDPELRLELEAELIIAATQDVRTRPLVASWIPDGRAAPEPTSRGGCMLLANMALEEVIGVGSRERAVALAERALVGAGCTANRLWRTSRVRPSASRCPVMQAALCGYRTMR
jgi:hypothetical protein